MQKHKCFIWFWDYIVCGTMIIIIFAITIPKTYKYFSLGAMISKTYKSSLQNHHFGTPGIHGDFPAAQIPGKVFLGFARQKAPPRSRPGTGKSSKNTTSNQHPPRIPRVIYEHHFAYRPQCMLFELNVGLGTSVVEGRG